MNSRQERWGPRPFRFELMWLEDKKFPTMVKEWRKKTRVEGSIGFKLPIKLKVLKGKIKEWAKNHFGDMENFKRAFLKKSMFLTWKTISLFFKRVIWGEGGIPSPSLCRYLGLQSWLILSFLSWLAFIHWDHSRVGMGLMLERVENKLSFWKAIYLSISRRITLINSSLQSSYLFCHYSNVWLRWLVT